MTPQIIALNGGSSAGKSTLARALQARLPTPFLVFGVDNLMEAMPPTLWGHPDGILVAPDGTISVGPVVRTLDAAWMAGIAATAHAGANLILDLVLLEGGKRQQDWHKTLAGLSVLWVGVHCAPEIATAREAARGDRDLGTAAAQALRVHEGIQYDLTIDTSSASSEACAEAIFKAAFR